MPDAANDPDYLVVKLTLASLAGLFLILSQILGLISKTKWGKGEGAQRWFGEMWKTIDGSRWSSLPERTIEQVLKIKIYAINWSAQFINVINDMDSNRVGFIATGIISFSVMAAWFSLGWHVGLPVLVVDMIAIPFFFIWTNFFGVRRNVFVPFAAASLLMVPVFVVVLAMNVNIFLAAVLMTALVPIIWLTTLLPFLLIVNAVQLLDGVDFNSKSPAAFAIIISLSVTLFAMMIGHLVSPDLHVPQTFQMLISNTLLDGLTMILTFAIFAWALNGHTFLRIPTAISIDVAVAAVLACSSLYFGLVFSHQSLSIGESINVLIAKAPDGSQTEFGPYFWAMHTTFLPTVAYLGFILLAWLCKVMLGATRLFLKIGYDSANPVTFSYGVSNVVWAAFAAAAGMLMVL